jgi:hypothetical protein
MGSVSDLMDYFFSGGEIYRMNELSYSRLRVRGNGWYTKLGVQCVCDVWNKEHPNDPVAFFQTGLVSDVAAEAVEKNYDLVATYRGNTKYNNDFKSDGSLDGVYF